MPTHTTTETHSRLYMRIALGVLVIAVLIMTAGFISVFAMQKNPTVNQRQAVDKPFPLGVDARAKRITEQPNVERYLQQYIAQKPLSKKVGFLRKLEAKLLSQQWYQNLASANTRILVIYPGQRREEVVKSFGDILGWDEEQRAMFQKAVTDAVPNLSEGVFFPGKYIVSAQATPTKVAQMVRDRFQTQIQNRYTTHISQAVSLKDALIVASLLEREAYTFEDMRIISGVIWKRLFADMKLQLDASLQYAKGSQPYQRSWWPSVQPRDKYIDSPYNTYRHKGLPPAPIANPSAAAVLAALNPKDTDCLFYFHDESGTLYCSPDYPTHVFKLQKLYGRGK